jgi:hypothetical protein
MFFSGCHQVDEQKLKKLNDSVAVLKNKYDFRPLNEKQAYEFMNKYYLPTLDTVFPGRRIFVHPLVREDLKNSLDVQLCKLKNEFDKDSVVKVPSLREIVLGSADDRYSWKAKKLVNTTLILTRHPSFSESIDLSNAWLKKYLINDYIFVSYPQYNPHSRVLVIDEYHNEGNWCGVHKDPRRFVYLRIPGGWKLKAIKNQ